MSGKVTKGGKKGKDKDAVNKTDEADYYKVDQEQLREDISSAKQKLEKVMLERNCVQLERDAIQEYYDITRREVKEIELAINEKDREMELLEDNHRVELRVYQQKVKHLEYEHKNNLKDILRDGSSWLDSESHTHEKRERELLKMKEQMKFQKMELELVNASKVNEIRQLHEKQLIKLKQQFDDGLVELSNKYSVRLKNLEYNLELQRRVEVHEVEERKNQHINDLISNHKKAFDQMKSYYNGITSGNLIVIKNLQNKKKELDDNAISNKQLLNKYEEENKRLSEPLDKKTKEISEMQNLLRERAKDQMALRNTYNRLNNINKSMNQLQNNLKVLDNEYNVIEKERNLLYNSFEETLNRIQQQTDFQNQSLQQKLLNIESNTNKISIQTNEIMNASDMDNNEMNHIINSLNVMLSSKNNLLNNIKFEVIKAVKTYNDLYEAIKKRFIELGIDDNELIKNNFNLEKLPTGTTTGPADLISSLK